MPSIVSWGEYMGYWIMGGMVLVGAFIIGLFMKR